MFVIVFVLAVVSMSVQAEEIALVEGYTSVSQPGPSQVIVNAGCNLDWLSFSMEQSNITLDRVAKLQAGTTVVYPEICAEIPPPEIVAKSREIIKKERVRLSATRAPRHIESISPRDSEEINELRARNIELEKVNENLRTEIATAQKPASGLIKELETAIAARKDAESKLHVINSERDKLVAENAALRAEKNTASSGEQSMGFVFWGYIFLAVLGGVGATGAVYHFFAKQHFVCKKIIEYRGTPCAREHVEVGAMSNIPVISTESESDSGIFKVPDYRVLFNEEWRSCPVTRAWRTAKNASVNLELGCPNSDCPEMKIHPDNMKSHLATKCVYEKSRRLRAVRNEENLDGQGLPAAGRVS